MKNKLCFLASIITTLSISCTAYSATDAEMEVLVYREKVRLDHSRQAKKSHCNMPNHGQTIKCERVADRYYKRKLSELNSNPELYFKNKKKK